MEAKPVTQAMFYVIQEKSILCTFATEAEADEYAEKAAKSGKVALMVAKAIGVWQAQVVAAKSVLGGENG